MVGDTYAESLDAWMKQTQELTSVTLAQAVKVRSFVGKWKVIKSRVELLSLLLADLTESSISKETFDLREFLGSVISSLKEALVFAKICTDLTYGGKLQMQSNLESLATKLNICFKDCQLMVKSAKLRENALVSSASSVLAGKEAIKWSVNDLLARVQIGNSDSKLKVLTSLIEVMNEDDKSIMLVASEGGIPTLLQLLDASAPDLREKAAVAVCSLAAVDNNEQRLLMEGAVAPMVRLLESGSALANEKAAMTLQHLTHIPEYASYVVSLGGLPSLLETCRCGTPAAQEAAAGSLCNLCLVAEIREQIHEERPMPILLYLVSSGTALAQQNAMATLQILSHSSEYWQQLIVNEGGTARILMFLDVATDPVSQEIGMGVIQNLAASSANSEVLLSEGIVQQLAGFLTSNSHMVQESAAAIVCSLALSTKVLKLMGEEGCIPPLLKLLDAKTTTAQDYAIQALSSLLLVSSNRKLLLRDKSGVADIVRLLDSQNQISAEYAVLALTSLARSTKARKQMISAGACYYLERLGEAKTLGKGKLMEQLGRGWIHSLLKKFDLSDW